MSKRRKRLEEFAAHRSKPVLILYFALRLIVGALLVYHIIRGNYESAFTCLLALVLFVLPSLIERRLHIDLPNTLEIIILLFIFAAEILGELQSYYLTYPYWDTMLHTTCGFLTAAIGFSMIDILNRDSRIKFNLSPVYCAVAAFCFSMTVGVLWAFGSLPWIGCSIWTCRRTRSSQPSIPPPWIPPCRTSPCQWRASPM